jgi:gamma-glutamylcyclotransferase (GGCT)/AIG2-like uncharacterized protein YtfP
MANVVEEFRSAVTNFALHQQANATTLADNVLSSWNNVELPTVEWNMPSVNADFLLNMWAPYPPQLPTISATSPDVPTLTPVTVPTFESAPQFTLVAPVVNLPAPPSATLPGAPGSAPVFNAPSIPDAPVMTLPDVPVFENLAIPAAPSVDIPVFNTTLPIDSIVAPTSSFSFVEQEYQSSLLDALKTKLMQDLVNGGYGIETQDELALWDRAMGRELRNTESAMQEAARQAAARGFALPPGAMFAQLEAARQDGMEKNSSASRDIALKRADMYVENRKFTIQQVKETEEMLITYFGYMMERALNAAKAVVELGVQVFNAKLAQANYNLDKYKAQAQVYEVVLRAALANLEAYKIKIEGARLSADVQRIHAEVYRVQLEGVNALANLYRTQMDGAKTRAEIERLRLDGFKLSVETYAAQVGAKQSEFGMYESRLKGEMSKVAVYQAQVNAYGTEIEAYKGKVGAATAVLEAQILPNKLKLEQYHHDTVRYTADVQKSQVELQAVLGRYEADVRAFSAEASVGVQYATTRVAASKANADIAAAAAKLQGDLAISRGQLGVSAANAFASVEGSISGSFASLAGSAISAASTLEASISQGV